MCGIFGFNFVDKKLLNQMALSLSHRGPDNTSYYTDNSLSLGHNRLSIIDLSFQGNQPLYNEDQSIVLICNGEIYNYKSLRSKLSSLGHKFSSDSDCEVIIHLYEESGVKSFTKLNGIFSFALYDSKKKNIFLVRDHLGVKPLYYYHFDDVFVFASELKAFLKVDLLKTHFREDLISQYMSFRYLPGDQTFLSDIFRVSPGSYIEYSLQSHALEEEIYWNVPRNSLPILSKKESIYLLKNQLSQSVNAQLMSDVPLGVFLSGGLDSSSIVGLMKNQGVKDIKTFSIGFSHDEDNDDIKKAEYISDYYGTDHKTSWIDFDSLYQLPKILWHLDEPIADPTVIPTYYLSKEAKKDVTVVLTGEGADEIFGGYVQYKHLNLARKLSPLIPFKKQMSSVVNVIPDPLLSKVFDYPSSLGKEGKDRLKEFISELDSRESSYLNFISVFTKKELHSLLKRDRSLESLQSTVSPFFSNKYDFIENVAHREIKTWLPDYILTRLDRMTMAHGLEGRVPFLDKDLITLGSSIPRSLKIGKQALRKSMKDYLPKSVCQRKKYPFNLPLDRWFSNGFKEFSESTLESSEFVKKYINAREVKNLCDKAQSNLLHSRRLWSVITLSEWHKLYIENSFN